MKGKIELNCVPWRNMGILWVINNRSGQFGSVYDEKKREGLYDKFWKHLTVMCARWVTKSALGQPQLLHKMITGTFTMPSEVCVSSVAGQIFCRGEFITEEGLPTWSMDTDLWAQDLNVPLFSNSWFYTFCAVSPASPLRPSHPCASSPPLASPILLCLLRELFFLYSKVLPSAFLAGFLSDSCVTKQKTKLGQGI